MRLVEYIEFVLNLTIGFGVSHPPLQGKRYPSQLLPFYYYCIFTGDQPAPGCNKRKMLQCRNKTDKDGDYSSCS